MVEEGEGVGRGEERVKRREEVGGRREEGEDTAGEMRREEGERGEERAGEMRRRDGRGGEQRLDDRSEAVKSRQYR